METIGFIGLGLMGRPMAKNLLKAGYPVVVHSRSKGPVDDVVAAGARAASSPADVARQATRIITMVPDSPDVEKVLDGPEGVFSAMQPGTIVIDMSSIAPAVARRLAARSKERGGSMLDAPVSGGDIGAINGTLSIMVGGDPAVIDRCRPVLESMGERIFATGALGSGHAMKALNNLVSAAGLIAATEALLIGRRFGLDPNVMIDVLNASTGRNNSTENKFKQFVLSRRFASGFSLDLMVKDLATALDLAHTTATPAPFSAACRELWAAAQAQLDPDVDHTAVVRWFEEMAKATLGTTSDQ